MIGFTFFQFGPVTCHNFIYYCSRFTYNYILVKGALDAHSSKLMPDKKDFGYSFP
ncbi:hypothetical protein Gohar_026849, partial [Gossypium harknessii]|nr:hypothetical protein [Gossypium harknessii]